MQQKNKAGFVERGAGRRQGGTEFGSQVCGAMLARFNLAGPPQEGRPGPAAMREFVARARISQTWGVQTHIRASLPIPDPGDKTNSGREAKRSR